MSKHQIHFILFVFFSTLLMIAFLLLDVSLWWLIVFIVVNIFVFVLGITNLQFNYFFKSFYKGDKLKKQIALTFDDGPSQFTPKILDLLKHHKAKATFFCVGKNIDTHPDIFMKIDEEGHTIGNHTYSHAHNFDFLSTSQIIEELKKCNEAIESLISKKTVFFRPPNGVSNPMIGKAIKECNMLSIAWNVRTFDTFFKDEQSIFKRIAKKIEPGSIILMHDTMPHTVNLVSILLEYLKNENFEVVTVDELLKIKAYE